MNFDKIKQINPIKFVRYVSMFIMTWLCIQCFCVFGNKSYSCTTDYGNHLLLTMCITMCFMFLDMYYPIVVYK